MKFGNIGSHGKVDAYLGGLGKLVIILFEPPPYLARLHPNHRVVSSRVIGGTVEQIGANTTLLQQFVAPIQPMLDHVGEKLFAAAAVAKRRTGQDVVQLLENRGLVHFLDDGRASFLKVRARHRPGWYRHQSTSVIQAWSITTEPALSPQKRLACSCLGPATLVAPRGSHLGRSNVANLL